MHKDSLDQRELGQLRQYWEDPSAFDQALRKLLPEDVRSAVRHQVASAMEAEGKHFVPGTASMWGGEQARRELALLRAHFAATLMGQRDAIYSAVCERLRYCERKHRGEFQSDHFNLAVAVADSLLSIAAGMPFPITAVTVYMLRYGFLDDVCGCS